MISHRGNFVRKKLKTFNIPLVELADSIQIDQSTLFRWFNQADLSMDKIILISKYTGVDFRTDFPEMEAVLNRESIEKHIDYKSKYYAIMEKYTELQEQVLRYGLGSDSGQEKSEN